MFNKKKKSIKSFEDIYQNVPLVQKERFRIFRELHPVKYLQISDTTWEYIVCGKGKNCLVLLAGGARFYDIWFELIMALEDEYMIIAPTIPSLPRMELFVEGIRILLDYENVNSTYILGTSFGGLIAQCFVRSYSERVDKLILSNTLLPDTISKRMANFALKIAHLYPTRLLQLSAKWNIRLIMTPSKSKKAFWKAYWKEKTQTHLLGMSREETISTYKVVLDLAKNYHFTDMDLVKWPGMIYLIESDNDIAYIKRASKKLRLLYPDAQVYTFHKAGHTPGYSKPKEYGMVINRYLKD